MESWCLTSSCLETASQTSQKSSERGKFTSHTLCNSSPPSTYTQKALTHTLNKNIHCLFIRPLNSWWDYKFDTLDAFCSLSDTSSRRQTHLQHLVRAAIRGNSAYTNLHTCSSSKTNLKLQSDFWQQNQSSPVMLLRDAFSISLPRVDSFHLVSHFFPATQTNAVYENQWQMGM